MPARLDDHRYYTDRARQARAEADAAVEPHIRKLHIAFAERYDRAANALLIMSVEDRSAA